MPVPWGMEGPNEHVKLCTDCSTGRSMIRFKSFPACVAGPKYDLQIGVSTHLQTFSGRIPWIWSHHLLNQEEGKFVLYKMTSVFA